MTTPAKTHYEVLDVPQRASQAEIKAAYRKKAMQWHPDRHEGKASRGEAEEKMRAINTAFEVLSNAHKKIVYDASLVAVREGARASRRRSAAEQVPWARENTREQHAYARPKPQREPRVQQTPAEREKAKAEARQKTLDMMAFYARMRGRSGGTLF